MEIWRTRSRTTTSKSLAKLLRQGLLLVGIVVLGACSSAQEVRVGDGESRRTVSVDVGSEFSVQVATNASIGWRWEITVMPEPEIAVLVDRTYQTDDPEATGSGGTDVFRFRAAAPGETTVTLTRTYRDEGPDRVVTISVRVR